MGIGTFGNLHHDESLQILFVHHCMTNKDKSESNPGQLGILTHDLDEDVLSKMPKWFRILRRAYIERVEAEE